VSNRTEKRLALGFLPPSPDLVRGICTAIISSRSLHGIESYLRSENQITESQNHRIVGVGRDLCGSSSPTPLPKQGHLQHKKPKPSSLSICKLSKKSNPIKKKKKHSCKFLRWCHTPNQSYPFQNEYKSHIIIPGPTPDLLCTS